jgi:integrase/recombinase XerC
MSTQNKASEFTLSDVDVLRIEQKTRTPRDMLIVELLYRACLRVSEVARLDVRDVDLSRRRLTVLGKGNKERVVPLSAGVVTLLRFALLHRTRGPVFVSRNGLVTGPRALTARQIRRMLAAAAQSAGVLSPNPRHKQVNPHLLRHSGARKLLASGVSLRLVSHYLGHASYRTTVDTYGTPTEDEIADAVSSVWDADAALKEEEKGEPPCS